MPGQLQQGVAGQRLRGRRGGLGLVVVGLVGVVGLALAGGRVTAGLLAGVDPATSGRGRGLAGERLELGVDAAALVLEVVEDDLAFGAGEVVTEAVDGDQHVAAQVLERRDPVVR